MNGTAALLVILAAMMVVGLTARAADTPPAGEVDLDALLAAGEEEDFWQDVTLRLADALPNNHPKLASTEELYLGLRPDGPAARTGQARWRKYVLGFSALFDPRDLRTGDHKHYNWMDDEGVLLEVREDGDRIHLVVAIHINPDPWICGGRARYVIDLTRKGNDLAGAYTGTWDKAVDDAAGPAGRKTLAGKVTGTIRKDLWPSPVEGYVGRPKPGEHPRLIFRKGDLPALRKRMATPEGKAILARLAETLKPAGANRELWHGYGYGLMYQLTGEAKWADAAKEYAQAAIEGKITCPRYGWYTRDGGYMRVGPSVAATAHAYDMCYDGWDPAFRQWVARKIQDRIFPKLVHQYDLKESDGQFNQRSNHYGLWQGGAGQSILAIKGDEGTDEKIVRRSHRIFMRRLKRGLEDGFGDHGWFYEGTFCGRFPTVGALSQYIQAMRVAEGRDYVTGCSEAQWLITKWIYEAVRLDGQVTYHTRGMYKQIKWQGLSGDFSVGFGIVPEAHKPAVLWFYNHVIEPGGPKLYDAAGPKEAVYAFVNWPLGLEPRDPAEVLGCALYDRQAGFFALRSGWRGDSDVVVSMWGDAAVLGMGLRTSFAFGIPPHARVTHFEESNGKTVIIGAVQEAGMAGTQGTYDLAADFSGLCGAPVLLVGTIALKGANTAPQGASKRDRRELEALIGAAPEPARTAPKGPNAHSSAVTMGGRQFMVMTVQPGAPPAVRVVGEGKDSRILVGKRAITFDGEKIVLGKE